MSKESSFQVKIVSELDESVPVSGLLTFEFPDKAIGPSARFPRLQTPVEWKQVQRIVHLFL